MKYSLVVRDDGMQAGPRGFNIFYWGTVPVVRTLHLGTMVRSFLCELDTMLVGSSGGGVYLRAVPVRSPTMLGIIPMSLHLTLGDQSRRAAKSGLSIGETMTVMVDQQGRIGPIPRRLALPADADQRLAGLAGSGAVADRGLLQEQSRVHAIFTMDRAALDDPGIFVKEASQALTFYRMFSWVLDVDDAPLVLGALEALIRDSHTYSVLPVSSIPGLLEGIARGLDRRDDAAGAETA